MHIQRAILERYRRTGRTFKVADALGDQVTIGLDIKGRYWAHKVPFRVHIFDNIAQLKAHLRKAS